MGPLSLVDRFLSIVREKGFGPHLLHSLVMTGRHLKLAEEYVSIAKVTMSSSLRRLISKLFGDVEALPNITNCRVQITTLQLLEVHMLSSSTHMHYNS